MHELVCCLTATCRSNRLYQQSRRKKGWLRNLSCPAELFLSSRNTSQKAHVIRISDVILSWQSLQLSKFWAHVLFDVGILAREKMCISTNIFLAGSLLKQNLFLHLRAFVCAVLFIHSTLSKISLSLECSYFFKTLAEFPCRTLGYCVRHVRQVRYKYFRQ